MVPCHTVYNCPQNPPPIHQESPLIHIAQTNSGPIEAPPTIHFRGKRTHESNLEEHQFHQDTEDNTPGRVTNRKIGVTLQPSLHQDLQYPTNDSNLTHLPFPSHIQPGK